MRSRPCDLRHRHASQWAQVILSAQRRPYAASVTSSPETVRAVVLNVEDAPVDPDTEEQLDRGQGKVAGLVGLAKLAWRITAFARRPFAAPFALATPIIRGVVNTDSGPAVAVRHQGRMVSPKEWAAAQQQVGTGPRI